MLMERTEKQGSYEVFDAITVFKSTPNHNDAQPQERER